MEKHIQIQELTDMVQFGDVNRNDPVVVKDSKGRIYNIKQISCQTGDLGGCLVTLHIDEPFYPKFKDKVKNFFGWLKYRKLLWSIKHGRSE